MQPFLTRSSRTSGTTTCSLSNVLLSTSKSTAVLNGSTAKNTNIRTTTATTTTTKNHTDSSSLFRRFGDFYKRFYSTVSENAGPARGFNAVTPNGTGNICGSGSVVHGGRSVGEGVGGEPVRTAAAPPNPAAAAAPPVHVGRRQPSISSAHIHSFRYLPSRPTLGRVRGRAAPDRNGPGELEPGLPADSPPNSNIEVSVYKLVRRLEDHDRLLRALETEIQRRNLLYREAQSATEKEVHAKEVQSLQKVYVHIATHYYDTRVVALVMKAVQASQSRVAPLAHSTTMPYLPPFPHYDSPLPPVALNKSMLNLFHPRTPPPRILIKISYNLLTSNCAPNAKTYNILLRGFTIHRQNSLAHMVFHSMVDLGMPLDDYGVVAVVNLCVKSADYDAYRRVLRILQTQAREGGQRVRRSKMVYEAMIHGAAKFGHLERIRFLIRAIKRHFPDSPFLSMKLLTSLLRLWTQKRNWKEGKVVWKRMKRLDRIARVRREEPATDLRAYYQMFQFCKSCGREPAAAKILEEARVRGWVHDGVSIVRPQKTKGLHVTSEVKVPRLAELTQLYARYKRKNLRSRDPGESRRNALMRLLENAFDSYNTLDTPKNVAQDDEFLEKVLLPPLKGAEEAGPPDQKPNEERSKIWSEILSYRLAALREEITIANNIEALISQEAPKSDTPEEDTLAAYPLGWKPDLIAYARGTE
ncbi:hypothetical protein BZA05DRAFT_470858 [Tricharina praecox]|uniref:uncharacterized protein n=1 Tax=Tricharina praecox TaxID=43433 RepID=UPI002220494F|nr:uncharacterized protein BZA05DRAFT_470858 [Tricharina praecox]KAI5858030.1 hypothetical protein BZA05DRAFT_470858 [Tricharina praecox]